MSFCRESTFFFEKLFWRSNHRNHRRMLLPWFYWNFSLRWCNDGEFHMLWTMRLLVRWKRINERSCHGRDQQQKSRFGTFLRVKIQWHDHTSSHNISKVKIIRRHCFGNCINMLVAMLKIEGTVKLIPFGIVFWWPFCDENLRNPTLPAVQLSRNKHSIEHH